MGLLIRTNEFVEEYVIRQDMERCPFCFSSKDKFQLWHCFVKCTNCGAEGPTAQSEQVAINLWNMRRDTMPNTSPTGTDAARRGGR